jgi:hypothetical protein
MKRISINKDESVAEVIEKILAEPESELTLVIPKNSLLKDSAANFHLITREAAAVQKSITIESVDEEILKFSETAHIGSSHPLFRGGPDRPVSDIIPLSQRAVKPKGAKETALEKEADAVPEPAFIFEPEAETETESEISREKKIKKRRLFLLRPAFWISVFIAGLLAGGAWLWSTVFSRAEITINFKKIPWQYDSVFVASKAATRTNIEKRILPAEVFSDQKNLTQFFPASGKAEVSQKATGKITIYNAYSSAAQPLVATTRFVTPEGLIFRLDSGIVVPGAEIKNGKVVPASIEANVTADKPGPAYNISSTPKLTIPGFKGSPKYDGFYGALKDGAKGGFIGEKAVPTEADLTKAKEKTAEILKSSLQAGFLSRQPENFKILGEPEITITRLNVNKNTDQNGNFSVLGEARFRAIGFKDSDLQALLQNIATVDHEGMILKEVDLKYGPPKSDFDRGEVSFRLVVRGTLVPAFSAEDFKTKITGRSIQETRTLIGTLPDLSDAKVSLWPRWQRRLPGDLKRISVVIK